MVIIFVLLSTFRLQTLSGGHSASLQINWKLKNIITPKFKLNSICLAGEKQFFIAVNLLQLPQGDVESDALHVRVNRNVELIAINHFLCWTPDSAAVGAVHVHAARPKIMRLKIIVGIKKWKKLYTCFQFKIKNKNKSLLKFHRKT